MFVRGFGNYDADKVSEETGLGNPDPDFRAQQSFKEECDINEIVRRFGLTGEMPGDFAMPVSGVDVSEFQMDYKTALDFVHASQAEFMRMPPELRARFENDPGSLLAFLNDSKNREEAVKLGLISKPPEVTRDAVKAIDELAAKLVVPKPAA